MNNEDADSVNTEKLEVSMIINPKNYDANNEKTRNFKGPTIRNPGGIYKRKK